MGVSNSSDEDVISAINITPLVDVVLVLLVIFMITAPVLYQSAIKVKLPTASTGEHSDKDKQSFNFTVSAKGEVAWDNQAVDWETLAKRLSALDEVSKQKTAFISADKDTPHGTVIRLMDTLRQAGVTHLGMSVEPAGAAKDPGRS
ncbi:MAG TPA: biopolymer transporter ExbD [bacterium]|nr:biopolymer transporter ExbD [bacterium]